MVDGEWKELRQLFEEYLARNIIQRRLAGKGTAYVASVARDANGGAVTEFIGYTEDDVLRFIANSPNWHDWQS